jgi:hypothetical protein
MRMLSILFALSLAPAVASAQLIKPDSAGLARTIAKAIRPPIQRNGAPRAAMVTTSTIGSESAAWNVQLGWALKILDSSLVSRRPTKETLRVNVVSMFMGADSASGNVAMSRCFDDRFVGTSVDYAFKKRGGEWVVVYQKPGFAARGACPKK